jgi:flavin-dependent dehydrogenase
VSGLDPQAAGHFDVAVVGAGPAGAAAAITAARRGRSVLLVDSAPPERVFRVGESLPPGGADLVKRIFGPDSFRVDDHLRSVGNRAAWGRDQPVDTDFMFNPLGTGWHLDRSAFDARLVAAAEAAGVEVWRHSSVHTCTRPAGRPRRGDPPVDWTIGIDAPVGYVEPTARVVGDATGRRAMVARKHGGRLQVDDRLVGFVAVFEADRSLRGEVPWDRDHTTTIEAVEHGWWYTAAIPGARRVVAHLTDGDLLDQELRTAAGFWDRLRATAVVGPALGDLERTFAPGAQRCYRLFRSPSVVAAGSSHLRKPVGRGWVAAGDAAASFDPLSSQGIVAALLSGQLAGELLAERVEDPTASAEAYEAHHAAILERYRDERRTTYALEQRWPDAPFWRRRHHDEAPTRS